jgi:hypothetical protein
VLKPLLIGKYKYRLFFGSRKFVKKLPVPENNTKLLVFLQHSAA